MTGKPINHLIIIFSSYRMILILCIEQLRLVDLHGSFTVELKYFRSMPWYKAIFLSNFFNFTLVLFRTLWYNRVG